MSRGLTFYTILARRRARHQQVIHTPAVAAEPEPSTAEKPAKKSRSKKAK